MKYKKTGSIVGITLRWLKPRLLSTVCVAGPMLYVTASQPFSGRKIGAPSCKFSWQLSSELLGQSGHRTGF